MNISQTALAKALRILLIIAGFFCVALGTVGIFMPVLPTTPFYLLATFCFMKGSTRFHNWFINTKLYKKHLESFANNRSMTIKAKLRILIPVTTAMIIFMILAGNNIIKMVLTTLLLVKWWYFIYRIKTIKPSRPEEA